MNFEIKKSDDDLKQVFGWASVASRSDGEVIKDYQGDIIEPVVLEKAAYGFVADYATAGEMHERSGVGHLIESVVFTKSKAQQMGVPDGILPEGWWVGFQITDDNVWSKIKDGTYSMFSIGGAGVREDVI